MRRTLLAFSTFVALTLHAATFTVAPSTTNNDDSCDIAVLPAATLLLPYFEVDFNSSSLNANTTLFTVVNTTQSPQIARVTLWTDLGYPVVNFNLFLTGYDVQSINLYDILGPKGVIAPPFGTSSNVDVGDRSLPNEANPNFAPNAAQACASNPGPISVNIVNDIRNAFTLGRISACGKSQIGLTHVNAIGYATIDVVKTCGISFPTQSSYYDDLLYDNVLTGDYQTISPNSVTGNYAGGNPLVHIRAIPEGGAGGAVVATDLPYTFYDRYTPRTAPAMDRRQPLPSVFAARFIQGGTGAFNTNLQIWREGMAGSGAACADYAKDLSGSNMAATDIVRFDEHENPTDYSGFFCGIPICVPYVVLPEASSTSTSAGIFPPLSTSGDVGGWIYLNLNNSGPSAYSKTRASQNWAVVSMFAEGRFSVMFDATMLANGCTPPQPKKATIGPGPNLTP
ncbi:MAG TPA: hypothetical protein VII75_03200 [Thermoanaerobaculia bacterium]